MNSTLEHEYSGAANALSAWYGDDSTAYAGDDHLIPDGFDRVAHALSHGVTVRLSSPVRRIAPGQVILRSGETLQADRIVCTMPLGVLRDGSVEFAQPFAPRRAAAIRGLAMGLLNKCWLRFDRVAWPDTVDWIEWLGPQPGEWAEWVSGARVLGQPVLLGFNAGAQAARIEGLSERATVGAAREALRSMFGTAFPDPVAAQITRWGQDPFARGSYSFNAVGSTPAVRSALFGADWDGALWFAGEATDPGAYGTAHGAVATGRRVAQAILSA